MSIFELICFIVMLSWLLLHVDRRRAWPHEARLPDDASVTSTATATVVALVPARDEAEVLPHTLPALLQQDGIDLQVILIDDGSRDQTGSLARELADEATAAKRLRVLRVEAPVAGWSGKVHALAKGVDAVTASGSAPPDWLLLTDADIRHRPGSLSALIAQASQGPYDLVSVMARLRTEIFWERLLIPPFIFFFQLLYPFRQVRAPSSPIAAAAGGCLLVRPAALAEAGGLEAIRDAVIDDVSLARKIKEAGGRLWLGFDDGIVSVRPYRGLDALWRMVARSAFVQLRCRYDLLVAVLLLMALFVIAPPWLSLVGLAGALLDPGADAWPRAALWAFLAWTLEAFALWPAVRQQRVPSLYAWTLPLASIFYGLMTSSSAWHHWRGRGAEWKGRHYGGRAHAPAGVNDKDRS